MNLQNKKILVTGGAGFVGSHTADTLINRGAQVCIIDNLTTGRKERVNAAATFYQMNIADPKVAEVIEKERPEVIYHFAANVLVPKSVENPLLDMDSIAGAVNVLKNAQKFGVKKVIFSSSGFVYGNTNNLPAKEIEPIKPISPYVVAKNAIENYLRFFHYAYGLPYVIFRYAAVYGPSQITGAMADYINKISSGQQAEIWGDGKKTRDYVYIDDVVRANLLALDVPDDYVDPVFNIGTAKETTLNDLYKKIAELLHKKPEPMYLPDRPGEQVRYSLDYSKFNEAAGWQPTVSIDEGLRQLLVFRKLLHNR